MSRDDIWAHLHHDLLIPKLAVTRPFFLSLYFLKERFYEHRRAEEPLESLCFRLFGFLFSWISTMPNRMTCFMFHLFWLWTLEGFSCRHADCVEISSYIPDSDTHSQRTTLLLCEHVWRCDRWVTPFFSPKSITCDPPVERSAGYSSSFWSCLIFIWSDSYFK